MACVTLASNPTEAGLCLEYVQRALGLATCGATAAAALDGCGYASGSEAPGMLVFFSNGGAGHVGIVGTGGQFTSELSDGSVSQCDIQQFAQENGMSVAGYRNPGVSVAGFGVPSSIPFPSGAALAIGAAVVFGAIFLWERA